MARTQLSEAELRRLLGLMAEGFSNKQIGRQLGVSEDTVKGRVRILFVRLGATDRAHAVHIGHRKGWLT